MTAIDHELIERYFPKAFFRTADGAAASSGQLVRQVVLGELCPEHESGYRWSATSNYLNASLRALRDGRSQPVSRAQNIDDADRARIWELAEMVLLFWFDLCEEVDVDPLTDRLIYRSQLAVTALGRRLFATVATPRGRLSSLAA